MAATSLDRQFIAANKPLLEESIGRAVTAAARQRPGSSAELLRLIGTSLLQDAGAPTPAEAPGEAGWSASEWLEYKSGHPELPESDRPDRLWGGIEELRLGCGSAMGEAEFASLVDELVRRAAGGALPLKGQQNGPAGFTVLAAGAPPPLPE